MGNIKYFVYINNQSTRPLVHSLAEAKQHATRNISYKPTLRIECYERTLKISEWVYEYSRSEWVEQLAINGAKME
jgi:hypothetical protein